MPRASMVPLEVEELRFKALPPSERQAKFPARRKAIRRQPNKQLPRLTESQSTLTQRDFACTPPVITSYNPDSEDGMGDEGYDERPAKKPKRTKKAKDPCQPTYTQYVRSGSSILRSTKRRRMDDEGWEVFEDPAQAADTPMEAIRRRRQKRPVEEMQPTDWRVHNDDSENEGRLKDCEPEIANSSSQMDLHAEEGQENVAVTATPQAFRTPCNVHFKEIPSSQSPTSVLQLSTQRSRRSRNEDLSPLKERSVNVLSPVKQDQRPLKMNIESKVLHCSPTRPATTTHDYQAEDQFVRAQPVSTLKRLHTVQDSEQEASSPRSEVSTILSTGAETSEMVRGTDVAATRAPRKLRRVNTVQDSQWDDLDEDHNFNEDYECCNDKEPQSLQTAVKEVAAFPVTELKVSAAESLQANHSGMSREAHSAQPEPQNDTGLEFGDSDEDEDEDLDDLDLTYDEDYNPPQTYDPAYSALDRDAARFGQTESQLQAHTLKPYVSNSTGDSDNEELMVERSPLRPSGMAAHYQLSRELGDVADGAAGAMVAAPLQKSTEAIHDDTNEEQNRRATMIEMEADADRVPSSPPPLRSFQLGRSTKIQEEQAHAEDTGREVQQERLPSSPPAHSGLRPSQISTVVPTQPSPQRPSSGSHKQPLTFSSPKHPATWSTTPRKTLTFSSPSKALSFLSPTQQRSAGAWPDTLSSSPLPMPPWSSPVHTDMSDGGEGTLRRAGRTKDTEQIDSLADFSLPPPPPMSSSSKVGTQRSSPLL